MTEEISAVASIEQDNPELLIAPFSIDEALRLFCTIDYDGYMNQRRSLSMVAISEDRMEWGYSDGTPGGDAVDLLARYGSLRRHEWVEQINAYLQTLTPVEQQMCGPALSDQDESFPLDALPPVLKDLSHHLAELHGVPVPLPAVATIAVVGAAVGRGLELKTWRGMATYPNLYVLVGMPSGAGKSNVLKPIYASMFECERKLQTEHAKLLPKIEVELTLVQREMAEIFRKGEAADNSEAVEKLATLKAKEHALRGQQVSPRLVVEDITSQKLAKIMEENGDVMASLSADARGAGKILLGRHNEGSLDDDIYLKGFSGDSARQDRIGRGGAALNNPALTISWATQLDLFDQLFNNKAIMVSGLACRFLPLRIEEQASEPSYEQDSIAKEALEKFSTTVAQLVSEYHRVAVKNGTSHAICADEKARQVLSDYQRCIKWRVGRELAPFRSFALRWAEIAWRIALIFHCADNGDQSHLAAVNEETAANAVRVMKWFAQHQQQLLESGKEQEDNDKVAVALAFVNRAVGGATARDVYRFKQSLFDNIPDARKALDQLEREGTITSEESRSSRRFFRKQAPRSR